MRVLLAEDTPISAEAMKAMALHCSVELDIAHNGLQAIEMVVNAKAKGRPYSLLLIDVMMPILDGVEATKRLRAKGFDAKQLPIVAVTAASSFDEVRSYRASGMQAFLEKPVAMADFKATLEAWGHGDKGTKTHPDPKIDPVVLASLTKQFTDRNLRTLELIETALGSETITSSAENEIRNLLHQIAGTAATFGDAELSQAARTHEYALIGSGDDQEALRLNLGDAARTLRRRQL